MIPLSLTRVFSRGNDGRTSAEEHQRCDHERMDVTARTPAVRLHVHIGGREKKQAQVEDTDHEHNDAQISYAGNTVGRQIAVNLLDKTENEDRCDGANGRE